MRITGVVTGAQFNGSNPEGLHLLDHIVQAELGKQYSEESYLHGFSFGFQKMWRTASAPGLHRPVGTQCNPGLPHVGRKRRKSIRVFLARQLKKVSRLRTGH